jgi:formate dehydrogenase accessory protein FdhD
MTPGRSGGQDLRQFLGGAASPAHVMVGAEFGKFSSHRRVHSAALAKETVLFMYEDIGRHNAVDKVLGAMCLRQLETTDSCLVLSAGYLRKL